MYWQKRFDKKNPDKEIEEKIFEIREVHKDYGYRRMLGELRNQGYVINKKKVQRIMQKYKLQVTSFTRKSRKYSSYKGKVGTVAPNRIRRRFKTHIPHQKITTDTTEFKYYEVDAKGHMTTHKLYLDPFMDMCNGEILSYGIDKKPSAKNVMDALDKAIEKTGFPARDIHIPDTVAAEPPGGFGLRLPCILRQGIPIIDEHGQVMANLDLDIIPALGIPCRNNFSVRSHVVGELQLLAERFPTFEIVEYKRHQHQ